MTKQVLFLCTGNYYRSRFAEILFNVLAAERGLDWRAESRGLATELGIRNIGPISAFALRGLGERGIPFSPDGRYPLQAEDQDFEAATLIVALKESEHRPFVRERFPAHAARVRYWHIDDTYDRSPPEALADLDRAVRALLDELDGS